MVLRLAGTPGLILGLTGPGTRGVPWTNRVPWANRQPPHWAAAPSSCHSPSVPFRRNSSCRSARSRSAPPPSSLSSASSSSGRVIRGGGGGRCCDMRVWRANGTAGGTVALSAIGVMVLALSAIGVKLALSATWGVCTRAREVCLGGEVTMASLAILASVATTPAMTETLLQNPHLRPLPYLRRNCSIT